MESKELPGHFLRSPGCLRHHSSRTHPRSDDELSAVARYRHAAGQAVPEGCALAFQIESYFGCFVNQPLIAAQALVGVSQCRTRKHCVEMDVKSAEVGVFGKVQPNVAIAGHFFCVIQRTYARAHWYTLIRILQDRRRDASRSQDRPDLISQGTQHQGKRI